MRRLVADLGDGTYAVRFYRDGQAYYVRVDADLWVAPNGKPKYARFGKQNSLWVPIVEKAYAFFRTQQGNYPSLNSGDGKHHGHLHATTEPMELAGVTALQVIDWVGQGSPSGAVANAVNAGVVYLLNWIALAQANGEAVYTGGPSGISDSTPLLLGLPTDGSVNTYRSGQHQYMVDHVEFADNGQPVALVLRDPYGSYRTLTDFARIYFCIGRAVIWRP